MPKEIELNRVVRAEYPLQEIRMKPSPLLIQNNSNELLIQILISRSFHKRLLVMDNPDF